MDRTEIEETEMSQKSNKKHDEVEIEKIFQAAPLPASAKDELGECPPGMRSAVSEACCESLIMHDALYRALRASGD